MYYDFEIDKTSKGLRIKVLNTETLVEFFDLKDSIAMGDHDIYNSPLYIAIKKEYNSKSSFFDRANAKKIENLINSFLHDYRGTLYLALTGTREEMEAKRKKANRYYDLISAYEKEEDKNSVLAQSLDEQFRKEFYSLISYWRIDKNSMAEYYYTLEHMGVI